MPTWKVELIAEAQADFNSLDGSVKKRVLKQLVKLEQNPKYGDPLGNKRYVKKLREPLRVPGPEAESSS